MYAQDSIDMLHQAGIQFKRHEDEGISVDDFAELLISSGLVLCEDVTWIAFARSVNINIELYLYSSIQSTNYPSIHLSIHPINYLSIHPINHQFFH